MTERFAATMLQIRDYADQQVKAGRGDELAALDRRGLSALQAKHHGKVFLALPDPEHTNANGRVFLRAVF